MSPGPAVDDVLRSAVPRGQPVSQLKQPGATLMLYSATALSPDRVEALRKRRDERVRAVP